MIQVGDKIPHAKLIVATLDGPREFSSEDVFAKKKVVLFAVPGAFTPTCSAKHLPGFLDHSDALRAKGVDTIACLAVNDPFVMTAWAKQQEVDGRVLMIADGSGALTKQLGLELDLTNRGLGIRSQRYAMVVDDGTVTSLSIEEPGVFEVSSAETVLESL